MSYGASHIITHRIAYHQITHHITHHITWHITHISHITYQYIIHCPWLALLWLATIEPQIISLRHCITLPSRFHHDFTTIQHFAWKYSVTIITIVLRSSYVCTTLSTLALRATHLPRFFWTCSKLRRALHAHRDRPRSSAMSPRPHCEETRCHCAETRSHHALTTIDHDWWSWWERSGIGVYVFSSEMGV